MLNTKRNKNVRFQKPRRYRRYFLWLLVLLLVFGGLLIALEKTGVTNFYSKEDTTDTLESGETINYGPPSDEERQAGDEQKDRVLKEEETRNDSSARGQNANVIITDAGQYDNVIEVRAFVPDYYKDGTCIITFTKDDLTVKKETPAYRDVSTTICTNPNFARSEFQDAGNWQLLVEYIASGARGASSPQTVTIK